MMFAISYFLPNTKWTQFLCNNSIVIVTTHYPIKYIFVTIMKRLGLAGTIYYELALIPTIILVFTAYRYIICPFINKYLPFLNGKMREKSI